MMFSLMNLGNSVAPYVGAWIETYYRSQSYHLRMSHPMWVRGLKLCLTLMSLSIILVAPYVGAWIETIYVPCGKCPACVAPYVGAWIETSQCLINTCLMMSHPMWVRGLKLIEKQLIELSSCVAPYVGAWIETCSCLAQRK